MASEDVSSRLKTFALMLKFGHDLFEAQDVKSVALKAVNDSRAMLGFRNSMLFEQREDKKNFILAQFAQTEVHPHAAAVEKSQQLINVIDFDDAGIAVADKNSCPAMNLADDEVYLVYKFTSPPVSDEKFTFIWVLEYEKEIPSYADNTIKLLGKSVAEALSFAKNSSLGKKSKFRQLSKVSKYLLVAIFLIGIMFIPVRESVNAEFILRPKEITAAYAWFEGPIAKCFKQDGDFIRKGDVVAVYDVSQLQYRLANAMATLREEQENLKLEQRNSFTDESKLGKVKLLEAKCETLRIAVEEAQWFLDHSEIISPADGTLVLADGRAEQLAGKAVRTGDKIFEVFDNEIMVGKIMVNESDASILQNKFSVSLFLYTMPEKEIASQVYEVAGYPELTQQNTYCYPVYVFLGENDQSDLRFGMRGIAKLTGERVSLAYYLFKSVILYFRKW